MKNSFRRLLLFNSNSSSPSFLPTILMSDTFAGSDPAPLSLPRAGEVGTSLTALTSGTEVMYVDSGSLVMPGGEEFYHTDEYDVQYGFGFFVNIAPMKDATDTTYSSSNTGPGFALIPSSSTLLNDDDPANWHAEVGANPGLYALVFRGNNSGFLGYEGINKDYIDLGGGNHAHDMGVFGLVYTPGGWAKIAYDKDYWSFLGFMPDTVGATGLHRFSVQNHSGVNNFYCRVRSIHAIQATNPAFLQSDGMVTENLGSVSASTTLSFTNGDAIAFDIVWPDASIERDIFTLADANGETYKLTQKTDGYFYGIYKVGGVTQDDGGWDTLTPGNTYSFYLRMSPSSPYAPLGTVSTWRAYITNVTSGFGGGFNMWAAGKDVYPAPSYDPAIADIDQPITLTFNRAVTSAKRYSSDITSLMAGVPTT